MVSRIKFIMIIDKEFNFILTIIWEVRKDFHFQVTYSENKYFLRVDKHNSEPNVIFLKNIKNMKLKR